MEAEDNPEDNRQQKRSRIGWKDISIVKTFIEACIHAIALDGREGASLKVLSWKKVEKALKDNHNFSVDQKQMKNHFDYIKSKYTAWVSLKNKTGNIYDESTNTFNLSDEEWQLEIQKNKNVKSLRTTPLLFPDLCAKLYDGTCSSGIKSHGPGSTEPRRVIQPRVIEDDEDIEVLSTQPSNSTSKASSSSRHSVKNRKKGKHPIDDVEEEILGVLKVIADKINQSEPQPKPEPPTIEDYQKKLNDLGWVQDDLLYEVALAIFSEPNDHYREGWMQLKPERCANWVKMIGRSKGFM